MTSGPIAERPTSAGGPAHTDEPEFRRLPLVLSPCTNAPSFESAYNVRVNDNASSIEPRSIRKAPGLLPCSRNTTSEQSTAHNLPTGEFRLSALARKARIAFRAHPYVGARPNERKRCSTAAEPADEGLDANAKLSRREGLDTDAESLRRKGLEADVKALCREQVIPQPSFGEVSPSTMKQLLERKAVNTNELVVSERSPVAETALTPPKPPACSIRATSPRPDEIKPPSPVLPEQHGCAKLEESNNVRLPTSLGARFDVPKEAIIWPGVDPPSPAESRSSQPLNGALPTTRRPEVKTVVSTQHKDASQCLPVTAIQAMPAHLSRDEFKQAPPTVPGRFTEPDARSALIEANVRPGVSSPFHDEPQPSQPHDEAATGRSEVKRVVSAGRTSTSWHIPLSNTALSRPNRPPVPSVLSKRCGTIDIISTKSKMSVNTRSTKLDAGSNVLNEAVKRPGAVPLSHNEALPLQPPDEAPLPKRWPRKKAVVSIKKMAKVKAYEATELRSTDTQQLMLPQVQSSVVSEQRDHVGGKAIISKERIDKFICSPTLTTSLTLPKFTPTLASRAASHQLPKDGAKLRVEVATRYKSSVVNVNQAVSNKTCRITETRSRVSPNGPPPRKVPFAREQGQFRRAVEDATGQGPTNRQAQAQSSILLGEMGEERREYSVVNKNIRAHLTPCSPEGSAALTPPIPPSQTAPLSLRHKSAKTPTTKQCDDIVISKEGACVSEHMPEAGVTSALSTHCPMLHVQADAHQLKGECPCAEMCLPTNETARKQSKPFKVTSREDEGTYLERAAMYVRERMSKHALACHTVVPRARGGPPDKSVDADARQPGQEVVSESTANVMPHSPDDLVVLAPLVPRPDPNDIALPIMKTRGGDQELLIEGAEDHERQDKRSKINRELALRAPANPTPLATSPVLLQAHCRHLLSLELVWRARWKPPDRGGDMRRHACYVVNKKTKMSVILRSPKSSMALMPLDTSPALPQACSRRLPILELVWRARGKPPDATGTTRQPNINMINMDVRCLRTRGAGLRRSSTRPLFANMRANSPGHLDSELVSRVRKPPDPTTQRFLQGAAGSLTKGKWGHLLAIWPMLVPYTPSFPYGPRPQPSPHGCLR